MGVFSPDDKHIKMQKHNQNNSAQLFIKNAASFFPTAIDLSCKISFFFVCVNLNPEYFFVINYFDFLRIFYM